MAVQNPIPTTNVKVSDIRDTLNYYGGTVTNDTTTFFTVEAGVWHAAKYKPTIFNANFSEPDEDEPWWKAHDGKCGYVYEQVAYTDIPSIMDSSEDGMNGWSYQLPTGGSTQPLRLGDFRGYNPEAQPMVSNFYVPNQKSSQYEGTSFQAQAIVPQMGGDSITLGDLSLSNYYAAVLVIDPYGAVETVAFGDSVSNGTFAVDVPCFGWSEGTYTCYPFVSANKALSQAGERFYTLPGVESKQIKIVSSNFTVTILATRRLGGAQAVDYQISITNASTAVTWTDNSYRLRFTDKTFEDALDDGEMGKTLSGSISVAANTTTSFNGYISNVTNELWSQGTMVLWFSFNGGNHIYNAFITSNTQE